jgi:sialate O-acetylesterase
LAALELNKPENEKIRVFTCPRKGKGMGWQHANGQSLAMASAPGYFCVKNLQDSLGVPVGVISTAVGGTMIESWRKDAEWYKKMIAPYVPFAVRGILWYQGENNCTNPHTA